jgi:hypothetical protein
MAHGWIAPLFLAAAFRGADGLVDREEGGNPIRKVVSLMQNMQKEIEAEGAKEKELFDKFMCFCNGNSADLTKNVADAKAKIDELSSKLKSSEAEKSQADQDIVGHKSDQASSEKDLSEATAVREKESAEAAASIADSETNIEAVGSAIPALEKGMGAAALMQMPNADRLGKIFDGYPFKDETDRKNLLAFFQSSGDYVPQSGQIVGIMKQLKDEMEATLAETKDDEAKAVATFASLKSSKESEIETSKEAIETKTLRSGELSVTIVETQDALEDQTVELADSEKFLNNLDEQCATKQKEWDERQKVRAQEVAAVSEAIEILNDDDALDTFKKAIPSASFAQDGIALLQRSSRKASPLQRSATIMAKMTHKPLVHSPQSSLMLFTLKSKLQRMARSGTTGGFDGVTKMIDDLVEVEKKEQTDDDTEKPWCNGEFDKSSREETSEKHEIEVLEADLAQKTDQLAEYEEDIATMSEQISELDKAVADATEERKEGHEQYLEETHMSQVAVELVEKARQRMLKFYNPVLYKAPPKRERTMEEKIIDGGFFAQVRRTLRLTSKVAPPVAPETFDGAAPEKNNKSTGVIALLDQIIGDLKDDLKESERSEKSAQKDYQTLMSDSQAKRQGLTQGIKSREAEKAGIAIKKEDTEEKEHADETDVLLIEKHVSELHGSCDFILNNYDVRREARAQELEELKNAKAALAGAH